MKPMLARVSVPIPHATQLDIASVIFFLAVIAAVGALARYRPAWAIAAYLLIEPFEFARSIRLTTLTLPKIALVGIVLGLIVRRIPLRPLAARELRPLLGGAGAVVLVTLATIVPATFIDPVVRETFKAVEYVVLLVTGIVAFDCDPDADMMWNALGASVVVVCSLAIAQEFTIAPSGFYVGSHIVARIAGPIDGPNQLAGWLDVAVPTLAARALLDRPSLAFGGLAVFGLLTDALTYSRGGAVGISCGLVVVAILATRDGKLPRVVRSIPVLAIPIVAGVVPLLLAKNGAAATMQRISGADESNTGNGFATRSALWHAALRMFGRDPGLGVGAGNYELLTPTVGLIGVRTHANSLYLQSLAEGGVALFGAVVWTIVAAVVLLLKAPTKALPAGIAAGTIALAVHEVFDTLVFFPKVGDLWWLLVGVGAACAVRSLR